MQCCHSLKNAFWVQLIRNVMDFSRFLNKHDLNIDIYEQEGRRHKEPAP